MRDLSTQEKIIPVYIEEEMKNSYLSYSMSVIVGRALPDLGAGLDDVVGSADAVEGSAAEADRRVRSISRR